MLSAFLGFFSLFLAVIFSWVYRNNRLLLLLLIVGILGCFFATGFSLLSFLGIAALGLLWKLYIAKTYNHPFLFVAIIVCSAFLKLHLISGMPRIFFTEKFSISLDTILVGLLPLCFFVHLATKASAWKIAFTKGLGLSCLGIALLMAPAMSLGVVQFAPTIPSYPWLRYGNNLFFVATTEEALYRGFVQKELGRFLGGSYQADWGSLCITSVLFTMAHWFWVSTPWMLIFVFLAGFLYGFIYMQTKVLESAMIAHFLLNAVHMTLFSYHAM